jgi:putative ABC transport system ATP-binding protein
MEAVRCPAEAVAASAHPAVIEVTGLRHSYGGRPVLAVDHWRAGAGEQWLVLGASGSGKTTLLHLLAGLLTAREGTVNLVGQDLAALGPAARDRFRGRHVGIVPQRLHLVDCLTVLDNLLLARYLAGLPTSAAHARETLAAVGLADKAGAYPAALSYGQAQRVAVARAVVNGPQVILADEPTSNLDDAHCAQTLDLLQAEARRGNATLVIATHDQRVKSRLEHRLTLETMP